MAGSDTLDIAFPGVAAEPADTPPGGYADRPGFSPRRRGSGGLLVRGHAAWPGHCWAPRAKRDVGPHALAHLGAVDLGLRTAWARALDTAADEVDADPADLKGVGRLRSLRVRALADAVAGEVMERVGRALGAGPLCLDEEHSRRVADLTVYVRQHHAERSLAELGALVAEQGTQW